MEKLVLRGIMYGADKIPDTWFDRVPGNYYKTRPQSQVEPQRQDQRRYSDEYDDRDRRRDSHRSRSSIEKDNGRSPNDRYAYGDDNRYGYDDRYGGQSRDNYGDVKYRRDYREPDFSRFEDEPPRGPPSPTTAAEGGFAAGVAAAHMKNDLPPPAPSSAGAAPYVPYSNIYGSSQQNSPRQAYSPAPSSGVRSPQLHSMNQVSPPHRYADDDDYAVNRQAGYDGQYDNRDGRSSRRPQRPPMRSRSYDSYDSRDDHRSYREHPAEAYGRHRGKSPRRLSDTFDKSQRGLGYGAVGAIAGGLVGSGVGRGKVPATIGAVLGGLGANMFEARERFVTSSQTQKRKTSVKKGCATTCPNILRSLYS